MIELFPENLSSINVKYFLDQSSIESYKKILVIKYIGKYRDGSQGNDDAKYMFAKGELGCKLYDPFGIILDFSQLEYNWGDLIEKVFNIGVESDIHNVVIIGDNCSNSIGTLLNGMNSKLKATDTEWIFDNYSEAKDYLEKKI